MTESEYAGQLISLGCKAHQHDGIWWLRVRPGFYRPVLRNRRFPPKTARPNLFKAFLGYSHGIIAPANSKASYKVMQRDLGDNEKFAIESLSSNRRSKIRRGLKRVEIKLVEEIEPFLPRMMEVVIDARQRTGDGKPVEYYQQHGEAWKQSLRSLAGMKDNYFLVASKDGVAVAYYHCLVVEKTMSITSAKSHSEHLRDYPNDALIFTSLDYAFNHWGCDSVQFGDYASGDPALNQFKEGYGFQCVEIPKYEYLRPGVGFIRSIANKNH